MLVRMLKIVPLEGSEGEDKETMASSKEAVSKGGTDNSSSKGKKRLAGRTMHLKAPQAQELREQPRLEEI